jgi:hypothetical protein
MVGREKGLNSITSKSKVNDFEKKMNRQVSFNLRATSYTSEILTREQIFFSFSLFPVDHLFFSGT